MHDEFGGRGASYFLMARPALLVDCTGLGGDDAAVVDRLARLALAARRAGWDLRLVNAGQDLRRLIGFCGLAPVLLGEPGREAEER